MSERPPVSLSQSLHCRMELWLNANGYIPEIHTAKTERTFLRGHLFEKALFDGFDDHPPVWPTLGTIRDYATGTSLETSEWIISDRQTEVELHGFKGHCDALLTHKDERVLLPDCKAVGCLSYKRSLTNDLTADVFAREYVGQLHGYRRGFLEAKRRIDGMILVYYNVCTSEVMFRTIKHDEAIDEEIRERLAVARQPSEPTPDHEWFSGAEIPLRCSYCSQKWNCATVRGMSLEAGISKGRPVWTAAA
jgi:hypothetical protein